MNRLVMILICGATLLASCSRSAAVPSEEVPTPHKENAVSDCWQHDLEEYRESAMTFPTEWLAAVDKASELFEEWIDVVVSGDRRLMHEATKAVAWRGLDGIFQNAELLRVTLAGNGRCDLSRPPHCEELAGLEYRKAFDELTAQWRSHEDEIDEHWNFALGNTGSDGAGVEVQAFAESVGGIRDGFDEARQTVDRFQQAAASAESIAGQDNCSDASVASPEPFPESKNEIPELKTLRGASPLFDSVDTYMFTNMGRVRDPFIKMLVDEFKSGFLPEILRTTVVRAAMDMEGKRTGVTVIIGMFKSGLFDRYWREGMLLDAAKNSGTTYQRLRLGRVVAYEMESDPDVVYMFWPAENAFAVVVGPSPSALDVSEVLAEFAQGQ